MRALQDLGGGQVEYRPDSQTSVKCPLTGELEVSPAPGREVYLHSPPAEPRPVQLLHGVLGIPGVLHQDEGKS